MVLVSQLYSLPLALAGGGGGTGEPLTASQAWFSLGVVVVLVIVAAFFSAVEIGIMTLNRIRIENAARRGDRLAKMQLSLRNRPQSFLSTILILYNVSHIALATYAAKLALDYSVTLGLTEQQGLLISTFLMTFIIVIFAELLPKTYAAVNPERLARFATALLFFLDKLLTPANWLIGVMTSPVLKLLTGGKVHAEHVPTREEVQTMLLLAHAGGHVEATDVRFAQEALRFSNKSLHDVMTPRVDVIAVADTESVGNAMTAMVQSGFSRLPVYHEDMDEISGVVLLKDLVTMSLQRARGGHDPSDEWANEGVLKYMRPVARYPGTKSVDEALAELRKERTHLAVVVDEHGGTAGVVTLEDILEELVGDIQDESDSAHSVDVVRRSEGVLIVTGRARIDALPELENVDLGETESQTLGGLLMERLGRAVVVGDSILLPCKPGHFASIAAQPLEAETAEAMRAAAAEGGAHGLPAGNGGNGTGDPAPRCTGLRVTALKVLRTRIKLMKVETVTDVPAAAS